MKDTLSFDLDTIATDGVEFYFNDEEQEIMTITREGGYDMWKHEVIEDKKEYFKRKLKGE